MVPDPLRQALAGHRPGSAKEAADMARLAAARDTGDVWSRSAALHVTGSALVVHPARGQVLLRWHVGLGRWLQVGGHADTGEVDPWAVALREAREETGLTDLAPYGAGPVQIVIVDVPDRPARAGHPGEVAHQHADIRYLLATGRPERARAEDRASPLWWGSIAEARSLIDEANLSVLLDRAEAALTSRRDRR